MRRRDRIRNNTTAQRRLLINVTTDVTTTVNTGVTTGVLPLPDNTAVDTEEPQPQLNLNTGVTPLTADTDTGAGVGVGVAEPQLNLDPTVPPLTANATLDIEEPQQPLNPDTTPPGTASITVDPGMLQEMLNLNTRVPPLTGSTAVHTAVEELPLDDLDTTPPGTARVTVNPGTLQQMLNLDATLPPVQTHAQTVASTSTANQGRVPPLTVNTAVDTAVEELPLDLDTPIRGRGALINIDRAALLRELNLDTAVRPVQTDTQTVASTSTDSNSAASSPSLPPELDRLLANQSPSDLDRFSRLAFHPSMLEQIETEGSTSTDINPAAAPPSLPTELIRQIASHLPTDLDRYNYATTNRTNFQALTGEVDTARLTAEGTTFDSIGGRMDNAARLMDPAQPRTKEGRATTLWHLNEPQRARVLLAMLDIEMPRAFDEAIDHSATQRLSNLLPDVVNSLRPNDRAAVASVLHRQNPSREGLFGQIIREVASTPEGAIALASNFMAATHEAFNSRNAGNRNPIRPLNISDITRQIDRLLGMQEARLDSGSFHSLHSLQSDARYARDNDNPPDLARDYLAQFNGREPSSVRALALFGVAASVENFDQGDRLAVLQHVANHTVNLEPRHRDLVVAQIGAASPDLHRRFQARLQTTINGIP